MIWMFLLKKIVAPLFLPMTLILGILLLGLFLIMLTRKRKTGKIFVFIGILSLGMLSYHAVSDKLLQPLEYRYPSLLSVENIQNIKWIVVLGGGHVSDPKLPANSQLSRASLVRLVEGIRLYRGIPKSKLILSGGKPFERTAEAKIMAEVAVAIGVKGQDLILEELSKDTEEEAQLIHQVVGRERFVLVTSASHMPRSIALFGKLGMDPIPAPTDYLVKESQEMNPSKFYPKAENLYKAERAFYEYLGWAWAKLRGRI
jgi:uncharacterized SAM-binding protein YcdF (DUF218 family)